MPKCTKFAAAILAALVADAAHAADLGPEWRALSEFETRIVFRAPGLDGATKRFLKNQSEDFSYTVEIGTWLASWARHPIAAIQFAELAPRYHFRTEKDLKKAIREWDVVEGEAPTWLDRGSAVNALGRVSYQVFKTRSADCVGFLQYWGEPMGEHSSPGTKMISGYYCVEPGVELSPEKVVSVLKGIGVKGEAAPGMSDEAFAVAFSSMPTVGAKLEDEELKLAFARFYDEKLSHAPSEELEHVTNIVVTEVTEDTIELEVKVRISVEMSWATQHKRKVFKVELKKRGSRYVIANVE